MAISPGVLQPHSKTTLTNLNILLLISSNDKSVTLEIDWQIIRFGHEERNTHEPIKLA